MVIEGQRINCVSCGLVYPCPISPPAPPIISAGEIELELEEPEAPLETTPVPAGVPTEELTLQHILREPDPVSKVRGPIFKNVMMQIIWLLIVIGVIAGSIWFFQSLLNGRFGKLF